MARDTDVEGRSLPSLWRVPVAGGRSLDGWFDGAWWVLATQAAHAQTMTLDDDFDHLIARLASDAQHLSEHLRRLKDITNDARVMEALRVANLPKEELT